MTMKLFEHTSYDAYRRAQIHAAKEKEGRVWVTDEELWHVAAALMTAFSEMHSRERKVLVCHGCRTVHEVDYLQRFIQADAAYGTDIHAVDGVVCHDFNYPMRDAIPFRPSIIYSNALDHSNHPAGTLQTWREEVGPYGIVGVQWSPGHDLPAADAVDCFQGSLKDYVELGGEATCSVWCLSARSKLLIWRGLR